MDIGPTLCAKILKLNGPHVHRLSYCHLTEDEINSPREKEKHQLFYKVVAQKLDKAAQSSDFGEGYETLTYKPYADDDGDGIGHAMDADDKPMPLTFDNYLGVEVVLPNGVRELDLAMCVSPSSNGSKMRSLWTNQMKS